MANNVNHFNEIIWNECMGNNYNKRCLKKRKKWVFFLVFSGTVTSYLPSVRIGFIKHVQVFFTLNHVINSKYFKCFFSMHAAFYFYRLINS